MVATLMIHVITWITTHLLTWSSASEMTYIVSSGALNSTHSLTLERWKAKLAWLVDHGGHFTHKVVTCQPQIRHRSGKVHQPKTDVLSHATNQLFYMRVYSKPYCRLSTGE